MRDAKGKQISIKNMIDDLKSKQDRIASGIQNVINNGNFSNFPQLANEVIGMMKRDIVDRKMSVAAGCMAKYGASALTLGYADFEIGNVLIKMSFY